LFVAGFLAVVLVILTGCAAGVSSRAEFVSTKCLEAVASELNVAEDSGSFVVDSLVEDLKWTVKVIYPANESKEEAVFECILVEDPSTAPVGLKITSVERTEPN